MEQGAVCLPNILVLTHRVRLSAMSTAAALLLGVQSVTRSAGKRSGGAGGLPLLCWAVHRPGNCPASLVQGVSGSEGCTPGLQNLRAENAVSRVRDWPNQNGVIGVWFGERYSICTFRGNKKE